VAASAELMFGAGLGRPDFLYVHIGHHVGAGLVLGPPVSRSKPAGWGVGDFGVRVVDGLASA
jgi:predicted NBD/HSP70 family sugar kinase